MLPGEFLATAPLQPYRSTMKKFEDHERSPGAIFLSLRH